MTVKELIEELSNYDPDWEITCDTYRCMSAEIELICKKPDYNEISIKTY